MISTGVVFPGSRIPVCETSIVAGPSLTPWIMGCLALDNVPFDGNFPVYQLEPQRHATVNAGRRGNSNRDVTRGQCVDDLDAQVALAGFDSCARGFRVMRRRSVACVASAGGESARESVYD